jgi:hypothetical protein
MIKTECDRCGKQQETEGATVKVAVGLLSRVEIPLPEDWRRVDFPERGRKELCPGCVEALYAFLEGDGAVAGLLEPETLEAAEAISMGERGGQLVVCPEREAVAGECGGWYERGRITEHMQEHHAGGGGRGRCPYCAHHGPSPMIGQHVAADHPGEYEGWRSGGQQGM